MELPVIDLSPSSADGALPGLARAVREAACDAGFFYCVGHTVPTKLTTRLAELSKTFFEQTDAEKRAIAMEKGGRAWRGYFPLGQELTSGRPDQKEGLYFGAELPSNDPRVRAGLPLHGANLFPALPGFRDTVLEYLAAMTALGHRLMELLALSLELPAGYFYERYTRDPFLLFRIFHYPALPPGTPTDTWGVGEHTDYGLLTILAQDATGGLEVHTPDGWVDAPPLPGAFVCNLGDMLERMTGGLYRSTPHRVRNTSGVGRLSFPFFFDPAFEARIEPIRSPVPQGREPSARWDGANVHDFQGTYGDYLLAKVGKVFPGLGNEVL